MRCQLQQSKQIITMKLSLRWLELFINPLHQILHHMYKTVPLFKSESIVCIIEAMKLFNEIEAEIDGEIVEVLVKDGEFVEYGQPLFLVKPR